MNISSVFSVPASATTLVPYRRMKLISTGAAYADATDAAIGTLLPGDPGSDLQAAVQDIDCGLHFATIGNGTDIAIGDALEAAAAGKLVKKTTGIAVAIALEACTADGDIIRVKYLPAGRVIAAGIHSWAGGAAATDSITVVGLEITDVVIASLAARAAAETLVLAANDGGNDQIDLTLSAAGTNTTTKVHYLVIRP